MENTFQTIIFAFVGIGLLILIITKPYIGIVLTIISLPVVDLLPTVPLLSSILIPIGAATIAGFLFEKKGEKFRGPRYSDKLQIISLIFVFWIFLSNPMASLFGEARNWFFTFIQCWILLWLSKNLMGSEKKQQTFMWIFSVVCVISAVFAITEGQIGSTISDSVRAGGLADQPNITARYLVIAMVFLTYLISVVRSPLLRVLVIVGVAVTFIGVFFTLSRTGIVLLMIAAGLIILSSRGKRAFFFFLVFVLVTFVLINYSSGVIKIVETIIPSITQGQDTIGYRYALWRAGWRMWLDKPIAGVGIGKFIEFSGIYAIDLPFSQRTKIAHNTYISVLAETGIVGLIIFACMLFYTLKNFLSVNKKVDARSTLTLRNTWLIVFITIFVGSLTKNDQYDKFFWFIMGISVFFQSHSEDPKDQKDKLPLASPPGSNI